MSIHQSALDPQELIICGNKITIRDFLEKLGILPDKSYVKIRNLNNTPVSLKNKNIIENTIKRNSIDIEVEYL